MEYHEVASIFPMMDDEAFDHLKADIAKNGLIEPIWLHPNGKIIDGRNRYKACTDLGIEPESRTWNGQGSLLEFVVSLNLHRRHLTVGQRGIIAQDILPRLEEEGRQEKSLHARDGHKNVQDVDNCPHPAREDDSKDKTASKKSRDKAGNLFGVSGKTVGRAKKLAAEHPDLADEVREGKRSLNDASKEAKKRKMEEKRDEKINNLTSQEFDTTRDYHLVYADPPWRYEHSKTDSRKIENHYPTMSLEEICNLPVSELAADDAVLFLWTTSPKLAESFSVIDAWGFIYRTCMIWDKKRIGMGYYARQQHEVLLIAARGSLPVPEPQDRPNSIVRIKRDNNHSAKPHEFYEIIERMYPKYRKIELFARNERAGWDRWGNEA